MMSVGLSVGAPKLMTRLPDPQRMNSSNSSKWFTRPTHKLRGTDHHARGLVPAPTHLLSFLITTPPVMTLFRSWNTIPSPWAALRSRALPRRAAAARGPSRPSHTHGPKSKCRLPSALRNSRCWGPRPCTRHRRSHSSSAPAAEVTTRQNAARATAHRHWVFRARAARAWRLYRRRSRRCADDRAWLARPVLTLGLGLNADMRIGSKRAGSQPPGALDAVGAPVTGEGQRGRIPRDVCRVLHATRRRRVRAEVRSSQRATRPQFRTRLRCTVMFMIYLHLSHHSLPWFTVF
ncbi:hypothetical protein EDB83DRAFT_69340 [Lactarius deliciosus]|nr:hypothetical protein EDB83DRAFT_69340 [Lactarius deliciosus]